MRKLDTNIKKMKCAFFAWSLKTNEKGQQEDDNALVIANHRHYVKPRKPPLLE